MSETSNMILHVERLHKKNAALEAKVRDLRAALEGMLQLFGRPLPEEYVDGGASYKLATETVAQARAALNR